MEAKDTVMSQNAVQKVIDANCADLINQTVPEEYYPARWHREIQAEISFKAGYEQAKRELTK